MNVGLDTLRTLCLVALSLSVLSFGLGQTFAPDTALRRFVARYQLTIERDLTKLRAKADARLVVAAQAAALALTCVLGLIAGKPLVLLLLPFVATTPQLALRRALARRWSELELQIEPWVGQVSNNLRATASLAEAISSTSRLIASPMREEIQVLVRDMELGTPLDEALERMSERIPSRTLAGTVLALKVARRSGGDLPSLLEDAAAALRELARLEGVLRTKTAEGRAQTAVIGAIPLPMVLAIHYIDPHFFDPLTNSMLGYGVVLAAVGLWLAALASALKILAVEI